MKNSEMKTIIRHIDRLTRNLNAKGRRRDAGSEKVKNAIYATADKIRELVNDLCNTLKYDDIYDYREVSLAIKACENSFPKQSYNKLNSIFEIRERAFKKLSSLVEKKIAKK